MPDKIVNHFVLADGSIAKYDAGSLLNLDDTVSLAGYAPDAKAVGDRLSTIEETANHADELATTLNEGGLELKDSVIEGQVDTWLDDHPEATTTVQDGAITKAKINTAFLPEIENAYVTPEMFGAKGDGVTDDTTAVQTAIDSGEPVFLLEKTYYVLNELSVPTKTTIKGTNRTKSVLKFGDGINGLPINTDCLFSNFTVSISGDAVGVYFSTTTINRSNVRSVVCSLTINHRSDTNNGAGIMLEAENGTVSGAFNIVFSNIDFTGKINTAIWLNANVRTTSATEAWISNIKFKDVFAHSCETMIKSGWTDISGTNAVPQTGPGPKFYDIKFDNVSAQCDTSVAKHFCKISNIINASFHDCTPFDYYLISNTYKVYVLNATSGMCFVDFGFQPEVTNVLSKWFEFENGTDFTSDFNNVVRFLGIKSYNRVYGNFIPKVVVETSGVFTLTDSVNNSIISAERAVIGNYIVTATVQLRIASFSAGSNDIGRLLPSPSIELYPVAMVGSISQAGTPVRCRITTNGYLSAICDSAITSASTLRLTVTYVRKYAHE